MSAQHVIAERIRESGHITVAEFMEIALYHPECGYYATRAQRSGRAGDFYTSVDVGPLFGACLAQHLARLHERNVAQGAFDLVEAAAGNGRLSKDILDAARRDFPALYSSLRLHLVERSDTARAQQVPTLGGHAPKLASSGASLPARIRGAIVANELLDAMPCHVVTMTEEGLREVFVTLDRAPERFAPVRAPLSTPEISAQLDRVGARIERGWIAEVNLEATRWIAQAAKAIEDGELLLVDYGHEARDLYSPAHATGTLVRYRGHRVDGRWTESPGECDLSAHVDFSAVRIAAETGGLQMVAFSDQTRFLIECGLLDRLPMGSSTSDVRQRLAARSLLAPEGLGGTMKVMILQRPRETR
jgi:SAM-dependent MidA family methyltransferase